MIEIVALFLLTKKFEESLRSSADHLTSVGDEPQTSEVFKTSEVYP